MSGFNYLKLGRVTFVILPNLTTQLNATTPSKISGETLLCITWADKIDSQNIRKKKRAKMALDRSPEFLRGLEPNFFGRFQRRIYKNFFMSTYCK